MTAASADESLLSRVCQVSYITDDIDAFAARLRDRFGVERFLIRHDHSKGSPASSGAILHLGLALIDGLEIEIIQPNPEKASIYEEALRLTGGVGLFHHLNHRLSRRDEWREAEGLVDRLALPVELAGGLGEDMRFCYPDARADFGHYFEFTYMEGAAAPAFQVPTNAPAPGESLFAGCIARSYLTRDLDAAVERLTAGYGLGGLQRLAVDGGEAARAQTGKLMLEVVQPGPQTPEALAGPLPAEGQLMRLHHLGFAAPDDAALDALAVRAERLGLPVVRRRDGGAVHVDARRELGHWLQYVVQARH
jgi:hypothetical protein